MTIKEFIEACQEFTEYAEELESDSHWVFCEGVSGPSIHFQVGTDPVHSYGPFFTLVEGWEGIHKKPPWRNRPPWDRQLKYLGLTVSQYAKLFQAAYRVEGHNKRLRRDLAKACGLADQLEQADIDFDEMRRKLHKKGNK